MHTRKNLIISDKNRRIGYLSPTAEGKKHDYRLFKEIWPPPARMVRKNTTLWLDLGFTGIDRDYPDLNTVMPKKKPRGTELTDEEKTRNKEISGFRVLVEHAISGIKRLNITTDRFRNVAYSVSNSCLHINKTENMDLMIQLYRYHPDCGIIT